MPKIAFVGAGSAVFTRNLVGDVLTHDELRDDTTFALMDIDADRLKTAEIVTTRLIEAHGAGAAVTATLDVTGVTRMHPVAERLLQAIDTMQL